jgi:hypothetical protein
MAKKQPKKPPKKPPKKLQTYDDYFPELGRELIRMLRARKGQFLKSAEPKFEDYAAAEYGHLLYPEERLKLLNYIDWSLAPRKAGGRELLPSEKVRRARLYIDEFEKKKAEFTAAGEKGPREKAIKYLMDKWHADRSTVEKRVAKKKGEEPPVEDALMYDRKLTDDDIPF